MQIDVCKAQVERNRDACLFDPHFTTTLRLEGLNAQKFEITPLTRLISRNYMDIKVLLNGSNNHVQLD